MSFIIDFLKINDLNSIRKKLAALYLLNVTDIIFTLFLMSTGLFIEINFIMAPIISNNQPLSLYIKIFLPLILLSSVGFRMRKATVKQLVQSNVIITILLICYGVVNLSHVIWLFFYVIL